MIVLLHYTEITTYWQCGHEKVLYISYIDINGECRSFNMTWFAFTAGSLCFYFLAVFIFCCLYYIIMCVIYLVLYTS